MSAKKILYLLIIALIVYSSCQDNSTVNLNKLEGYWQISDVKKDGKLVMEYKVSPIIDFWQFKADSSGFRKKVMPNLEGKIIITQHQMPFKISMKDKAVIVAYDDNGNTYEERITQLGDSILVIENDDQLIYTYTRYQPMNLSDVTKE